MFIKRGKDKPIECSPGWSLNWLSKQNPEFEPFSLYCSIIQLKPRGCAHNSGLILIAGLQCHCRFRKESKLGWLLEQDKILSRKKKKIKQLWVTLLTKACSFYRTVRRRSRIEAEALLFPFLLPWPISRVLATTGNLLGGGTRVGRGGDQHTRHPF